MPPAVIELIVLILSTLVTAVLLPAIRAWGQKSVAAIEELKKSGNVSDAQFRQTMLDAARKVIVDVVANKIEKEFPNIARKVLEATTVDSGGVNVISAEEVKEDLYRLGRETLDEVLRYFKTEGVDLALMFGEERIAAIIRSTVDILSPFPGQVTSKVLADRDAAQAILDHGVNIPNMEIEYED